jgi:hypothetical protein
LRAAERILSFTQICSPILVKKHKRGSSVRAKAPAHSQGLSGSLQIVFSRFLFIVREQFISLAKTFYPTTDPGVLLAKQKAAVKCSQPLIFMNHLNHNITSADGSYVIQEAPATEITSTKETLTVQPKFNSVF